VVDIALGIKKKNRSPSDERRAENSSNLLLAFASAAILGFWPGRNP
jgi:hypothetical protein